MNKKKMLIFLGFAVLSLFLSYLKISLGLGSYKFFFSGINFIIPGFGAFFSLPLTVAFLCFLFFIKKIVLGGMITFGIPTIISTIALNLMIRSETESSFLINLGNLFFRVILPAIAIVLFVINPIGQHAYLYSFYWFIPIALYFVKTESFFLKALTTTFIAHSIGSTMWLCFIPMSSNQWLSLIPTVAIERLVFACGVSIVYYTCKNILAYKKLQRLRATYCSK